MVLSLGWDIFEVSSSCSISSTCRRHSELAAVGKGCFGNIRELPVGESSQPKRKQTNITYYEGYLWRVLNLQKISSVVKCIITA